MKRFLKALFIVLTYIFAFTGLIVTIFMIFMSILPPSDYCIEDGDCPECPTKDNQTCMTKEECINGGYLWHEEDRWCKAVSSCEKAIKARQGQGYNICWTPDGKTHLGNWDNPNHVKRLRDKYPKLKFDTPETFNEKRHI